MKKWIFNFLFPDFKAYKEASILHEIDIEMTREDVVEINNCLNFNAVACAKLGERLGFWFDGVDWVKILPVKESKSKSRPKSLR